MRPVAPPVYRPQQLPRALQTKSSSNQSPHVGQAPRQPVAPPVYRPEQKKIVQPKAISQQRKSPTAPPVYRPEQKRAAQPKIASAANAGTRPSTSPLYRPVPKKDVQPKAMSEQRMSPTPPAHRPQPVPRILQMKRSSTQSPPLKSSVGFLSGISRAAANVRPANPANHKPRKPSHPANSGVVQGAFTYNRKQIREIVPVIVSLFQGSTGFLDTLNDYRTKHYDHRESFDLMQWFYAQLERRGWNDHDIQKKGDLRISLSEFIGNLIDGRYDGAQPPPQQLPPPSSRKASEPFKPEKVQIGFMIDKGAELEDIELLQAAFKQIKTFRQQVKNSFQNTTLLRLKHLPKSERPKILFDDYNEHLTFFDNELVLLESTHPFRTGALVLLKQLDRHGFIPVVNSRKQRIATVTHGDATFLPHLVDPNQISEQTRTMFSKLGKSGKEYVADNRGIPTSRFVYVEKNYYQFMQFLETLTMEGRYQLFHKAVGRKPDLLSPGSGFAAKQVCMTVPDRLTLPQLGVMHQMMGNGPQQRGVSLTSTSRIGAVFSNEGDPFREYDGVRIKVDLSKVPKDVMLLNHYAPGGISDSLESVNPMVRGGKQKSNYNYSGSVRKNREIYLEHLHIDWIDSIELHQSCRTISLSGGHVKERLEQMRRIFGHQDYVEGINAALAKKALSESDLQKTSLDFQRGFRSGSLYLQGHEAGKASKKKKQEHPFTSLAAEYMQDEKLKKAKNEKRFPDIYWLGWGHGYTGQKYDPLTLFQSQTFPLANPRLLHCSAPSYHSLSSSVNNNNISSCSISTPMSHCSMSSLSPSRPKSDEIPTQDPSSLLADPGGVWMQGAIGKIFKGRDGKNYKLLKYESGTGTFYFQLQ
jgi:hypothetical protein